MCGCVACVYVEGGRWERRPVGKKRASEEERGGRKEGKKEEKARGREGGREGGRGYLTSQGFLDLPGGGAKHLLEEGGDRDLQGGGGGEPGAQGNARRNCGFEHQVLPLRHV